MRDQANHVAGGAPVTVPPSYALRFLPVGGLAAFPRKATIGSRSLLIAAAEWIVLESRDTLIVSVAPSEVQQQFAAQIAANLGDFQGEDPIQENWIVEWAPTCPDATPHVPALRDWRELWRSQARAWGSGGKGKCSPVFDVRGFTEILINAVSHGNGWNGQAFLPCSIYPTGPNLYGGPALGPGGFATPSRTLLQDGAIGTGAAAGEGSPSPLGEGLLFIQVTSAEAADGTVNLSVHGRLR